MSNQTSGWEDEEQTVVSFGETPATPPAPESPAGPAQEEDPEATIVETAETAEPQDAEHTIVEGGAKRPSSVEDLAWLVLTKTQSVRRGEMFKLGRVRVDIGSGPATISINDRKVSRAHASIKYESVGSGALQFVLYDLASTNGTYVNGQRVTAPVTLKDGDRVGVGDSELVFKRV